MTNISRGSYRLLVWIWAVMMVCVESAIPRLPHTYGREFFLPYIDYSPWLLTIDIVPTFPQSSDFTVTIEDYQSGTKKDYRIAKQSTLSLNYTDIIDEFAITEFSGTHIKSLHDISVYVKLSHGDMMVVLPVDSFDTEYVIPQRSSPTDHSLVLIYTLENDTTVTTSCNLTADPLLNASHSKYSDQTSHQLAAYETLKLETSNGNTIRLNANKPIGVILLTVDVLYVSANMSFEDSNLVFLEFIPPRCTWGRLFYAVSFFEHGSLTFTISTSNGTNVTLVTQDGVVNAVIGPNSTEHFLCVNVTSVTMETSSPVQVYVIQGDDRNHLGCRSSYFLPPLEQYFRCLKTSSCTEMCPSFLSNNLESYTSLTSYSTIFSDASSSTNCTVRTLSKSDEKFKAKIVEVNHSFMIFLQDGASAGVSPAGSMLTKVYDYCVVTNGVIGVSDGIDNDCDGLVDEEIVNQVDDDGDSRIDEDTGFVCKDVERSRTSRSNEVRPSAADVFLSGVDYPEDTSQKPLIAVIVSLCVSIFAVFAVISIFMLLELISRRNQLRNTKIRPFVS